MILEDIRYTYFNERDVEVPLLLEFARRHTSENTSLLDVGAHYSSATYLKDLCSIVPTVNGVDVLPPYSNEEKEMFGDYIVGNVCDIFDWNHDLITCISTIEHSGISTYQEDDAVAEQYTVFKRICDLANRAAFFTFPFGKEGGYPGEFRNITSGDLFNFVCGIATKKFSRCHLRYFFNEFPQGREKWVEIDDREAAQVDYVVEKGCRCFCSLEIAQ